MIKKHYQIFEQIPDYEDRWMPYVKDWMRIFFDLSPIERRQLIEILKSNEKNSFANVLNSVTDKRLQKLLKFHLEDDEIVSQYKDK